MRVHAAPVSLLSGATLAVALFAFLAVSIPAAFAAEADGGTPGGGVAGTLPPGLTGATAYEGTNLPIVYPRSVWENYSFNGSGWSPSGDLRGFLDWLPQPDNEPPDYATVDRIILHDQGCLNPTQCTQNATNYPVRTIQNIYRSHAVTRGWGDIGYNYIIDRQGRIYEGRFGGNGVRGAHIYVDRRCENLNVGSAGVLLLGDLRAGPMTKAQSDSLGRLAAWIGTTNGFDASAQSATTVTWQNLRTNGGSCNLRTGSFRGVLTAPRLVSHGDVEPGNSDYFDVSSERALAKSLRPQYATYTYRREGGTETFILLDGLAQGAPATAGATAVISRTQLARYPKATIVDLPDGALVKSETRERVYVIENGERRPIPTAELFTANGYDWDAIEEVTDREMALWRIGEPLPYPDGTLVRSNGNPEIYLFENRLLRHVTSAQLFGALRLSWDGVQTLDPQVVERYTVGEPMKFPHATLIQGPGPEIYFVEAGGRRPILSADVFLARRYDWNAVVRLSAAELNRYLEGKPIPYPDGVLIRGTGGKVWLLQEGYRRWITKAETFLALGFGWGNVRDVSQRELEATPEAQPINVVAEAAQKPVPTVTPPPAPVPPPAPTPPPAPVPPPASELEEEPIVRVGLVTLGESAHAASVVTLSYDVSARLLKNGTEQQTLSPGQQVQVTPQGSDVWRVVANNTAGDAYAGIATVHSYSALAWDGSNDNRFRGAIEIRRALGSNSAFWVINELPIEMYLRGVAETLNSDSETYTAAFAIAARTYVYGHFKNGGKRSDEPFTIRRTSADQLYKGFGFELRSVSPLAGVLITKGKIATYEGNPIRAAYSSGGPGPTKDGCAVLNLCGAEFNYLRGGIDDPSGTVYSSTYPTCGGPNHCVGMDAAGARRLAVTGSTPEQVLKHYYPGIDIETRW